MATYSKVLLTGSTNGRSIKVSATSSPGTTIHTAHSTSLDEIWLYLQNTDTTDRKATVEFGGTTSPDDTFEVTIPAESGLVLVVPGLLLTNSLLMKVFAATANVIIANGFVNRIT